jgi:two-component system LytT family sensor kinase
MNGFAGMDFLLDFYWMNKRMHWHIIFWLLFLLWDIAQIALSLINSMEPTGWLLLVSAWSGLLDMLMKVLLFYVLYFFIYKPTLKTLRPVYITVSATIVIVAVSLLLQRTLMYFMVLPKLYGAASYKVSFFRFYPMVVTLFDMLVPVCLLFIYELYLDAKQRREREVQFEKEKLQSELRFLKAQINPHLLFNVLGTIHALTLHQAPRAAEITVRLSKIMRFMLYDAASNSISLAAEIKMLEDYIALENIRFTSKLNVGFIKDVPDESLHIAPLILLPFVENAFKHGPAESQYTAAIEISLAVKNKVVFFEVHNSVEPGAVSQKEKGIGLTNVKRQLQLLYPAHDLNIISTEKKFSVYLNFPLN